MNALFDKNSIPDGATLDRPMGVRVEPVRIISVNSRRGHVDCQAEGDSRLIRQVPMLSPYEHPDGSGLYTLPRPGALAFLMHLDRGTPRILAYRNEWTGDQGYTPKRTALVPGDSVIQTASGAYFLVRNEGIIEAVATPQLRWAMTPGNNRFFLRAESIDLRARGGSWRWLHDRATGQNVLLHEVSSNSEEDTKLTTSYGYHEGGELFRMHYEDGIFSEPAPGVFVPTLGAKRQATLRIGDLGGGKRFELDIDDGSYHQSIGQTGRGVVRTQVTESTRINKDLRPKWSFESVVGPDGSTLLQHKLEGVAGPIMEMKVDENGTCQMELNAGKTVVTIDPEGAVDLATAKTKLIIDKEGLVRLVTDTLHVVSQTIRLGSDEADERIVLGNMWKTYFDQFMQLLNLHQHIGNLGGPTGPIISRLVSFADSVLSKTVFSK